MITGDGGCSFPFGCSGLTDDFLITMRTGQKTGSSETETHYAAHLALKSKPLLGQTKALSVPDLGSQVTKEVSFPATLPRLSTGDRVEIDALLRRSLRARDRTLAPGPEKIVTKVLYKTKEIAVPLLDVQMDRTAIKSLIHSKVDITPWLISTDISVQQRLESKNSTACYALHPILYGGHNISYEIDAPDWLVYAISVASQLHGRQVKSLGDLGSTIDYCDDAQIVTLFSFLHTFEFFILQDMKKIPLTNPTIVRHLMVCKALGRKPVLTKATVDIIRNYIGKNDVTAQEPGLTSDLVPLWLSIGEVFNPHTLALHGANILPDNLYLADRIFSMVTASRDIFARILDPNYSNVIVTQTANEAEHKVYDEISNLSVFVAMSGVEKKLYDVVKEWASSFYGLKPYPPVSILGTNDHQIPFLGKAPAYYIVSTSQGSHKHYHDKVEYFITPVEADEPGIENSVKMSGKDSTVTIFRKDKAQIIFKPLFDLQQESATRSWNYLLPLIFKQLFANPPAEFSEQDLAYEAEKIAKAKVEVKAALIAMQKSAGNKEKHEIAKARWSDLAKSVKAREQDLEMFKANAVDPVNELKRRGYRISSYLQASCDQDLLKALYAIVDGKVYDPIRPFANLISDPAFNVLIGRIAAQIKTKPDSIEFFEYVKKELLKSEKKNLEAEKPGVEVEKKDVDRKNPPKNEKKSIGREELYYEDYVIGKPLPANTHHEKCLVISYSGDMYQLASKRSNVPSYGKLLVLVSNPLSEAAPIEEARNELANLIAYFSVTNDQLLVRSMNELAVLVNRLGPESEIPLRETGLEVINALDVKQTAGAKIISVEGRKLDLKVIPHGPNEFTRHFDSIYAAYGIAKEKISKAVTESAKKKIDELGEMVNLIKTVDYVGRDFPSSASITVAFLEAGYASTSLPGRDTETFVETKKLADRLAACQGRSHLELLDARYTLLLPIFHTYDNSKQLWDRDLLYIVAKCPTIVHGVLTDEIITELGASALRIFRDFFRYFGKDNSNLFYIGQPVDQLFQNLRSKATKEVPKEEQMTFTVAKARKGKGKH